MSIIEESREGRGRNKLRMERLRQNLKKYRGSFFNEHSAQKAGTQASAADIIHLAGEDPVKGRGRQRRSVAKTTSLWSSCWFAPVLLLLYPPSLLLSLSFSLTPSPSLTPSVPPVAIQAWAVFAAHEALDLPASVLLCSAAHTRMGCTTTQLSRKNTLR